MRPRISVRTILWLVTIAVILAGWMADRRQLQAKHRAELAIRNIQILTLRKDMAKLAGPTPAKNFSTATQ